MRVFGCLVAENPFHETRQFFVVPREQEKEEPDLGYGDRENARRVLLE